MLHSVVDAVMVMYVLLWRRAKRETGKWTALMSRNTNRVRTANCEARFFTISGISFTFSASTRLYTYQLFNAGCVYLQYTYRLFNARHIYLQCAGLYGRQTDPIGRGLLLIQ